MSKIRIRIDKRVKQEASKVFDKYGINLTDAVNMFLEQTAQSGKLPCSLEYEGSWAFTYPEGYFDMIRSGALDNDIEIPD